MKVFFFKWENMYNSEITFFFEKLKNSKKKFSKKSYFNKFKI